MYASDVTDAKVNNCCKPIYPLHYADIMRQKRYDCRCPFYIIEKIEIDASGSGFAVDDFVQLSSGTPEHSQPPALYRVSAVGDGGIVSLVPVLVPVYERAIPSPQPLVAVTGSGVGAVVGAVVTVNQP